MVEILHHGSNTICFETINQIDDILVLQRNTQLQSCAKSKLIVFFTAKVKKAKSLQMTTDKPYNNIK